jgi:hypothetical protein
MRIDAANHRPTITPITFGAAGYFASIAARAAARFSGVCRPRFSARIILRTGILHPTVCRMLGVLDLHPLRAAASAIGAQRSPWCRLRRLATQQQGYPCAQQFPDELAGMCSVAGHVVGKLYGLRSITRHDAHFNWWRVARKAPAIHRKPVPFRELEQHRGIAAGCHHASCWRVWFKPEFLQVLAAFHTDDTISSV